MNRIPHEPSADWYIRALISKRPKAEVTLIVTIAEDTAIASGCSTLTRVFVMAATQQLIREGLIAVSW
jgi:hypothetical protein